MNKLSVKELKELNWECIKRGAELKSLIANKNIINYEQADPDDVEYFELPGLYSDWHELTLKDKKSILIHIVD